MEQTICKDLYQETILDHGKNPRHYGCLKNPTHNHKVYNRLCGDDIHITAVADQAIIKDIKFEAVGCLICKASASLLCETLIGQPTNKITQISETLKNTIFSPLMKEYPTRQRCFTLPLECAKELF